MKFAPQTARPSKLLMLGQNPRIQDIGPRVLARRRVIDIMEEPLQFMRDAAESPCRGGLFHESLGRRTGEDRRVGG